MRLSLAGERTAVPNRDLASHLATLPAVAPVETIELAEESGGAGTGPRIRFQRDLGRITDARRRAVAKGFNASQPVRDREELHGRDEELETLFDAVIDRRNHALIYGARGSGKTSLVRVFADFADEDGCILIYTACDPGNSFARLIRPYLKTIPASCLAYANKIDLAAAIDALGMDFTPRDVVEFLAPIENRRLIFILDEFDRITDVETRQAIANFMKLLSDASIPVQIVAVGIAGDLRALISDHASLRRHLTPIPIGRISMEATCTIISHGAERAGIPFDEASIQLIAAVAGGSPYHVRLFCAHTAYIALRTGSEAIDIHHARAGLTSAVGDWATLNRDDSRLFERLTTSSSMRHQLAYLARMAASDDLVSSRQAVLDMGSAIEEALQALSPALVADPDDTSTLSFRDSVAPQFLLAMTLPEAHDDKVVSINEPVRHAQQL